MNIDVTAEVYRLRDSGVSFGKIAKHLGISKTKAFELAKGRTPVAVQVNKKGGAKAEPVSTETLNVPAVVLGNVTNDVLNVLDNIPPNEHLPVVTAMPQPANAVQNSVPGISERSEQNIPAPAKVKEFTGDELINKTFDCLPFTGKFEALIGKPSRVFSAIIWGLPKGGKSNLSVRFADYLQEYFGNTVYVASEEGESLTLQEKFRDIGGSKMTIVELRDKDKIRQYVLASDAEFVFIDSINNAGIEADFLEDMKAENPAKSFIGICQATKSGNFKGDQSITHNCDFMIRVAGGIASQLGRFGPSAEMPIFDEPLYEKNPTQRVQVNPIKEAAPAVVEEQGATGAMGNTAMHMRPKGTGASLLPGILKALEHHALSKSSQVSDSCDDAEQDEKNKALSDKQQGTGVTTRTNDPFVADWEDMEPKEEIRQDTVPKYNLAVELAALELERKYPTKKLLARSSLGSVSTISSSPKRSRGKSALQNAKNTDAKNGRKANKPADKSWGDTLFETGIWFTGLYIAVNWKVLTTKDKQQGGGHGTMK